MKNIWVYYAAIFLPLALIIILSNHDVLTSWPFIISLLLYVFVYRTLVDGKRLVSKKIIPNNDIWKLLIPGTRFEYFKALYFS